MARSRSRSRSLKNTPTPLKRGKRCGAQIEESFKPNNSVLVKAKALGFSEAQELATREEFVDYWKGVGRSMVDWQATYRNRLREVAKREGFQPPRSSSAQEAHQRKRRQAEQEGKVEKAPPEAGKARSLFGKDPK